MTNYQPLRPLMQSQSLAFGSTPLIPNRTGLMKPASPVRVRDSISHLPFLTLQRGEETEKAARDAAAKSSVEAQDGESKMESHLPEAHKVDC